MTPHNKQEDKAQKPSDSDAQMADQAHADSDVKQKATSEIPSPTNQQENGNDEQHPPVRTQEQIIQELSTERDQLKDQLLRALAEQDNLRKRTERDRSDTKKYAITAFARDLLTVADNLQRALSSAPTQEQEHTPEAIRVFVDGVAMTERELMAILTRHGVTRIESLGQRFDHNQHQAMFEIPNSDKPAGTVIQELQPGYSLQDRLLRPAMVGVARDIETPRPESIDEQA